MRAKLILGLLLGVAVSFQGEAVVSMHQIPVTADHEKEIEDWAQTLGAVKSQRLDVKGYRYLAVFSYIGSGTPRIMVYVYVSGTSGHWRLLAAHLAAERQLSLTHDERSAAVRVQSPTGRVYLTFPIEPLTAR